MKLSLKKMIFGMIALVCIITVAFQLIGIDSMFRLFETQKKETIGGIVSTVSSAIEQRLYSLNDVSQFLCENYKVWKYLEDDGKESALEIKNNIKDELYAVDRMSSAPISVVLIDKEERQHNFLNNLDNDELSIIKSFYSEYKPVGSKERKAFFFTKEDGLYYELGICVISPIRYHNTKVTGFVDAGAAIVVSYVNVFAVLKDMGYTDRVGILITDKQSGRKADFMKQLENEKVSLSSSRNIAETEWIVSGEMTFQNQTSGIYRIIKIVVTELIVIILLLFLVQFFLLNRLIRKPLSFITAFMNKSVLHNSDNRIELTNTLSEFESLAQNINKMLDNQEELFRKIVYTQQKLYESELSNKETALYALQSQINPHFLYNTMECMSALAMIYNAQEIADMVESMSNMFRYSLSGDKETTIEKEISVLKDYLLIMRVRYPDTFDVEFDFDEKIMQKQILRMLFQPIAENAVNHGFVECERKGIIKISGREENERLIVDFYDNGGGISEEILSELLCEINNSEKIFYTNKKIGLANINYRIRLQYGNEYGMSIMSEKGKFTNVHLELPLK